MAKTKKKEENPMLRMPGALLWIFACPLALLICGHYENKKSEAKREAKRAKKEAEFHSKYPEWWFYSN